MQDIIILPVAPTLGFGNFTVVPLSFPYVSI